MNNAAHVRPTGQVCTINHASCTTHWPQVPAFIWAPEEEGQFQPGRCSRWWLMNSLKALEADFKALGSSLIYRCAPESRTALLQLVQETGAQVCQLESPAVLPCCHSGVQWLSA